MLPKVVSPFSKKLFTTLPGLNYWRTQPYFAFYKCNASKVHDKSKKTGLNTAVSSVLHWRAHSVSTCQLSVLVWAWPA